MSVNIYSGIEIMRIETSTKTGGSYSCYLAYGTFETDRFGDENFVRAGYIGDPAKAPKGIAIERKGDGKYGGAQHYYHYILDIEEDFKYFILEVGSGKQTQGSKTILFTPLALRKESAQVEALENLFEQTAPIDSETIASLKNSLNAPDAIAPELLEAQKLVDDPEAIQRGYLVPEMLPLARKVIAETIDKSLPLTGDIGSPDDYWLENCEAYQEAAASFNGRKFGTFLRLVNAYKNAIPSDTKSVSKAIAVETAQLELIPTAEVKSDCREWIDPNLINLEKGTQTRCESIAKVAEYAEMMQSDSWDWSRSDIVIFEDESGAYPSDGHHRIKAAIVAEVQIFAEVRSGSLRDAIFESFASNKFHGLPLSREDKNNRAKTILLDAEWQQMSDRSIATHCGVSTPFVSKVRSELVAKDAIAPTTERKGKDGRTQKTKAKVLVENAEAIAPKNKTPLEPITKTPLEPIVETAIAPVSEPASTNDVAIVDEDKARQDAIVKHFANLSNEPSALDEAKKFVSDNLTYDELTELWAYISGLIS